MSTLRKRFDDANAERSEYLERVEQNARLTIPSVYSGKSQRGNSLAEQPWNSRGAQGVRNLVSKLLLSMFPTTTPYFRHTPHPSLRAKGVPEEDIAAFEVALYQRELMIQSVMDQSGYRARMRTAIEQLVVAGNTLLKRMDDFRLKTFKVDQFVWKRDSAHDLIWALTKELVDPLSLTDEQANQAGIDKQDADAKSGIDRMLGVYTIVERENSGWRIRQEINDNPIGEERHEKVNPYIAAGYEEIPQEDYARSFIDLWGGDLFSLNGLWRALTEGMAAASRCIPVADDTQGIRPQDLMHENGQAIQGRVVDGVPQGAGFLQMNKAADFSVAFQGASAIEQRLGTAMLLESASQPEGERVTAFQVSRIQSELEGALGGPYAEMAEELQRGHHDAVVELMKQKRALPPLPKKLEDNVQTQITTGAPALNRQQDLDKLLTAVETLSQVPGAMERFNLETLSDRIVGLLGIDTTDLIKDPSQIAEEQQQRAAETFQQAAAEQAPKTIGAIVEQQAKQ